MTGPSRRAKPGCRAAETRWDKATSCAVFSVGITKGGIYAVVAIGFNLIYSATGILNFAQGEFVMLGGMVAVSLAFFLPLPVAVAAAVVFVALLGGLLELVFFRRLRRHSILHLVIITIGLSIIIQEAALHVWDEKVRSLPYFTGNEISSMHLFGAAVSPQVLWVLGTVAVIVVFLHGSCHARPRACSRTTRPAAGIRHRQHADVVVRAQAGSGHCVIRPSPADPYEMGGSLAIKGFRGHPVDWQPMAAVLGRLLLAACSRPSA